MKSLKLIFLLAISSFIFQSCSGDDDTAKSADIAGKWNVSNLTFDIIINGESFSEYFTNDDQAELIKSLLTATLRDSFEGASLEFNSDGTYIGESADGTTDTGTWSLSSDGTVLTFEGGTSQEIAFQVVSSTNDSLELNYSETETSDADFDGTPDEITTSMDLALSK